MPLSDRHQILAHHTFRYREREWQRKVKHNRTYKQQTSNFQHRFSHFLPFSLGLSNQLSLCSFALSLLFLYLCGMLLEFSSVLPIYRYDPISYELAIVWRTSAISTHRQQHEYFPTHIRCTAWCAEWKFSRKSLHTKCHVEFSFLFDVQCFQIFFLFWYLFRTFSLVLNVSCCTRSRIAIA